MNIIFLVIVSIAILAMNIWVWVFPRSYLEYYKKIYSSNLGFTVFRKPILRLIQSDGYIWISRLVFGGGALAILIMVYSVYLK
jgi:hypothetical protein